MIGSLCRVRRPENWSRSTVPAWNSPTVDGDGTIVEIPVNQLCLSLRHTQLNEDVVTGQAPEWIYCIMPDGSFVWICADDLEPVA